MTLRSGLALGAGAALAAGLLLTPPGSRLLFRAKGALDDWYDRNEGIGQPCRERALRAVTLPAGVVADVPGCWKSRTEGGALRFTDPELRAGATMVMVEESGTGGGGLAKELDRLLQNPRVPKVTQGAWTVLRGAYSRKVAGRPIQYYLWLATDGKAIVRVTYETPLGLVRSPKMGEDLKSAAALVRSLRRA